MLILWSDEQIVSMISRKKINEMKIITNNNRNNNRENLNSNISNNTNKKLCSI